MKNIHIGEVIAAQRKEKGITQEELAAYIGISKAAVSKWESGQSYPDITLLPVLAAYFDLTVDDLFGYDPQLSQKEVQEIYGQLARGFATEPFASVYEECLSYERKYYSCWRLLFALGLLFVNHASLAKEKAADVYGEAIRLFERVEKMGNDPSLSRQALHLRASCYLFMMEPAKTIALLQDVKEIPLSTESLLAKAHQMEGDEEKAIGLLQPTIYQNLITVFSCCVDLLLCYKDKPAKVSAWSEKVLALGDLFAIDQIHPAAYATVCLIAAQLFATMGEKGKGLFLLERYAEVFSRRDVFPLKLKGNALFDGLDPFFASLEMGTAPPRNDELIKESIKDAVSKNPAFAPLGEDKRFLRLMEKLEKI